MALPDAPINFVALAAGCVAALGSALVPYYTGQVIDYASIDPDRSKFFDTCLRLVVVAALCGVFTGIRGGLFTLTMTRLNVRIRKQLFAALVQVRGLSLTF
jgi:ATP-binding cassette subfamily B (MDR/TAP) protein 9